MPTFTFDASLRPSDTAGVRRRKVVKYTGPISYATGGDPIAPADVGLSVIEDISENLAYNSTTPQIYFLVYDNSTAAGGPIGGKIRWFTATSTEVSAATNLSAATALIEFIGR